MNKRPRQFTNIGGQAVIEGVMMRSPKNVAIAIRKTNGSIIIDKMPTKSVTQKVPLLKLPILRGMVSFIESLILGVKALTFSAEVFEDEEGSSLKEQKGAGFLLWLSVIFAFAVGIGLFFLLPNFLIGLVKDRVGSSVLANLYEGAVRIIIFLLYVMAISNMPDIKRVFQYHGAEHKTIHCFESGKALEVKNARKFSRLHPRCGTSFLLIVMVVSILFFSFISWNNPWQRLIYRLLLLPIIAGVSYEIIRFAGRHENFVTSLISTPGMWLQRLTTYEPDDSQIEVAIAAMKAVANKDEQIN